MFSKRSIIFILIEIQISDAIFPKFSKLLFSRKSLAIYIHDVMTASLSISIQKQPFRGVLKNRCSQICSKFTGEHPCRSVISMKLQSNFIEITLRHGCSPINLLHFFRTPFYKNTSRWLLQSISESGKSIQTY